MPICLREKSSNSRANERSKPRLLVVATLAVTMLGGLGSSRAQSVESARAYLMSFERGLDRPVEPAAIRSLLKDLETAAPVWVAEDSGKTPARRRVAALAMLELGARATSVFIELETACQLLRKSEPGPFERGWAVAASSLMVQRSRGFVDHMKHARAMFPGDHRLDLLEVLGRPEAVTVANTPRVDRQRLSGATGYGQTGVAGPMDLDQTARQLQTLSVAPEISSEATARLGLVEFLRGQVDASMKHFEAAAKLTDDPYIRNMSWLMHGLGLVSEGRPDAAIVSYRSAFEAHPTISAATALAAHLFLSGDRREASDVLNSAYRRERLLDPWHDPVGSRRLLAERLNDLRTALGLQPRLALDLSLSPLTVPAPLSQFVIDSRPPKFSADSPIALVGTQAGAGEASKPTAGQQVTDRAQTMFRAATDTVMVDVSVYDGKTPVRGLSAEEFEIFDNGIPQVITASDIAQVPLDVTIVLEMNDPSARGGGGWVWQPEKALQDVFRLSSLLRPIDRLRILIAGMDGPMEALSLQPALSADPIKARVSSLAMSAQPTSTIFDATAAALMAHVPPERRALVVIFTDGIDGASVLTPEQLLGVAKQSEPVAYLAHRYMPQAPRAGQQFASSESPLLRFMLRPVSESTIDNAVRATGGFVSQTPPGDPAARFFDQVLASFRERYVFHYTPTGVSQPGWHTITVKLKPPKRYLVVGRKGYEGGR